MTGEIITEFGGGRVHYLKEATYQDSYGRTHEPATDHYVDTTDYSYRLKESYPSPFRKPPQRRDTDLRVIARQEEDAYWAARIKPDLERLKKSNPKPARTKRKTLIPREFRPLVAWFVAMPLCMALLCVGIIIAFQRMGDSIHGRADAATKHACLRVNVASVESQQWYLRAAKVAADAGNKSAARDYRLLASQTTYKPGVCDEAHTTNP